MKSNSTKLRNVLSLPFIRAAVAAVAAPLALGAAAPARAADSPDEDWTAKVGGEHRRIHRHNFITPNYVYSAMTNGSLAFAQGFGTYSVKSGDADANLSYYQQTFMGQIGILNRVSIDLYASGTATRPWWRPGHGRRRTSAGWSSITSCEARPFGQTSVGCKFQMAE